MSWVQGNKKLIPSYFAIWRVKTCTYLKACNLWDVIDDEWMKWWKIKPEIKKKKEECLLKIFEKSVNEKLWEKVRDLKNPLKIWNELEKVCLNFKEEKLPIEYWVSSVDDMFSEESDEDFDGENDDNLENVDEEVKETMNVVVVKEMEEKEINEVKETKNVEVVMLKEIEEREIGENKKEDVIKKMNEVLEIKDNEKEKKNENNGADLMSTQEKIVNVEQTLQDEKLVTIEVLSELTLEQSVDPNKLVCDGLFVEKKCDDMCIPWVVKKHVEEENDQEKGKLDPIDDHFSKLCKLIALKKDKADLCKLVKEIDIAGCKLRKGEEEKEDGKKEHENLMQMATKGRFEVEELNKEIEAEYLKSDEWVNMELFFDSKERVQAKLMKNVKIKKQEDESKTNDKKKAKHTLKLSSHKPRTSKETSKSINAFEGV